MTTFSKLRPGDVLWDCRRTKMGNTTMSQMSSWPVKIVSMDVERQTAMASWNSNAPRLYTARQLEKLRRSKPARS